MRNSHTSRTGFTIVELLIVIIVIGILAGITIIGYGAWRNSVAQNSVKNDLGAIAGAMESGRNFGTGYPTSIPSSFAPSGNVTGATVVTSTSKDFYCATARSIDDAAVTYYITSLNDKTPISGNCDGVNGITTGAGMVGWWQLNGTTAPNRVDGSLSTISVATPAIGQNGLANNAFLFSGASIRNTSVLGLGSSSVTVSAWFQNSLASNRGAFVKVGASDGYGIGMGSSADYANFGNKLVMVYEGVRWIPTTATISIGWHHAVMIVDSSGVPSAYLDGVFVGAYPGTGPITPTSYVTIGYGNAGARDYNGRIDDVRTYNRVLTATEISAMYSAGAL